MAKGRRVTQRCRTHMHRMSRSPDSNPITHHTVDEPRRHGHSTKWNKPSINRGTATHSTGLKLSCLSFPGHSDDRRGYHVKLSSKYFFTRKKWQWFFFLVTIIKSLSTSATYSRKSMINCFSYRIICNDKKIEYNLQTAETPMSTYQ